MKGRNCWLVCAVFLCSLGRAQTTQPLERPLSNDEAAQLVRDAVTRLGDAETVVIEAREREQTQNKDDDSEIRFGIQVLEGDTRLLREGDARLACRGSLFGERQLVVTDGFLYRRFGKAQATQVRPIDGTVEDVLRDPSVYRLHTSEVLSLLVQHDAWGWFFRYADGFRDLGPARVISRGLFARIEFKDWRGMRWEMWVSRTDPPDFYRVIVESRTTVGFGRGENPITEDGKIDRSKLLTIAARGTHEVTITRCEVNAVLPPDAFALPPEPFEPPPAGPRGVRRSANGQHVGDLRFKDLDGTAVAVDGTTGRPVVILLWQEKSPEMLVAARTAGRVLGERGDDVLILAVNGADTAERARELAREMPANVRVVLDPDQAMESLMYARMAVIAADGTVVWTSFGGLPHTFDELMTAVAAAGR